jgi:hypothetical protein
VPDGFDVYSSRDWLNRLLVRSSSNGSASNPSRAL